MSALQPPATPARVRLLSSVAIPIAAMGDSLTDYATDSSASSTAFFDRGFMAWLRPISNGRVVFTDALNFGIAGERTDQMVTRMAPWVTAARTSGFAHVLAGTNDIGAFIPTATIIANLQTLYTAALSAGAYLAVSTIFPRTTFSAFTAGQITTGQRQILGVNQWIREYAARSGGRVILIDSWKSLLDSATGGLLTSMTYDGLHLNQLGSYTHAQAMWAALSPLMPGAVQVPLAASSLDVYSATDNPRGSLLLNPWLSGTAGTVSGTGISGTVATSFGQTTVVTSPTGTVVMSQEAATDGGGDWQVVTFTNRTGATAETITFRQNIASSGGSYAAGDVLWAGVELKVDAGATGIACAFCQLAEAPGTGLANYDVRALRGTTETATYSMPALTTALRQSTEYLTVRQVTGVGTQQLSYFFSITLTGGTANGVVKFRQPTVKKYIA